MTNNDELTICVVEPIGQGGMIHYAYQMCAALSEAGASVTLITATDYELTAFPHSFKVVPILRLWDRFDARPTSTKTTGVQKMWHKVARLARRGWRGVRLGREWFRLSNYLLEQRPDIVQFSTIHFAFETFFLARLKRQGLVLTQICHEFERRQRNNRLGKLINRLYARTYPYFSVLFFHAEDNRTRFLTMFSVPPDRTHIIAHGNEKLFLTQAAQVGNPGDPRQTYGLTASEPVILFFGLLSPTKGLPDLVEAFAQIAPQTNARLVIAGYPTKFFDMAGLRAQISQHDLDQRVIIDPRYIPFEEVAPLVEMAAFLVFPYLSSTQSGALQVAYSFGRPVIASDVGGLPEAVDDGRSGYLIPPENPTALADKLLLMLNNPAQTVEMGQYAQQLSESRYSWEPISAYILSVYRDLQSTSAKN